LDWVDDMLKLSKQRNLKCKWQKFQSAGRNMVITLTGFLQKLVIILGINCVALQSLKFAE
jgi:hypothetical protein